MASDFARRLGDFEVQLRQLIHDVLVNATPDWWDKCIPSDVRNRADRIFQRHMSGGRPSVSKMDRLEFSDYQKIIDHNWDGIFENIFNDQGVVRARFKDMTIIRNKVAHSRATTDKERNGFDHHAEEIKKALLGGRTDHAATAHYLERYGKSLKDAYLGAVWAIHQDDHPDQTVQFAHSLREVIDLLARLGQSPNGADRRSQNARAAAIKNAVDPRGDRPINNDCDILDGMYDRLSRIAHHREKVTVIEGLKMLGEVCQALSRLTRPLLDVRDEVDRMMREEPSDAKAAQLVELLDNEITLVHAARTMPAGWLPFLIGASAFHAPSPVEDDHIQVHIQRPLSAYLVRCSKEFPGEVSSLILSCPASHVHDHPLLYPDFLRCCEAFDPKTVESIANKALDEGWATVLTSYRFADLFATFIGNLFKHEKYQVASALVCDGLKPAPDYGPNDPRSEQQPYAARLDGDLLEKMLTEIVRRTMQKNPGETIEMLARLLEGHVAQRPHTASSLPGCVASIEDSNQNGTGPTNAIVAQIRDGLVGLGRSDPGLLKSSLPLLYRKTGMLFRRIELYIYRTFPRMFINETTASLHMYIGRTDAHHEYYHLLKGAFPSLPEPARASLYTAIDRACSADAGLEHESDPAATRLAHRKFVFLDTIREHLDKTRAEEYALLSKTFSATPHPDYLGYMETHIGRDAAFPYPQPQLDWNDADKVLQFVVHTDNPSGPLSSYEDSAADKFEACVALNPDEYVKKSSMLANARPAIQYAFFAGVEEAIQKKRLSRLPDLTALITRIMEQERSPDQRNRGVWQNPLLRVCWLLDASLKNDAVGHDLGESIKKTILSLVEIGTRRGLSECQDCEQDPLTGALNTVNGMSFILLIRYAIWRGSSRGAGDRLDPDARKIIDVYLEDGAERHTVCRHSVIGLFIVAIYQRDPDWSRTIAERIRNTQAKAAFWSAYVDHNSLYMEMFAMLWKSYDIFLNGKLLYSLRQHHAVVETFSHVALAHFYGFEHADDIFEKFIREAKPETIERIVLPLALIMKDKEGDKEFDLKKAAKLWTYQPFLQLDLGAWFRYTPLNKRTAIRSYLDYLRQYEGKIDMIAAPVDEMGPYAAEFPVETASCLLAMVKKSVIVDLQAVRQIVDRLKLHDSPRITSLCNEISEAVAERGLDFDEDM